MGQQNADIATSRQVGGEGLENGKLSNGVSSDSDREVGLVECDSNGDEGFRFDKAKGDEHVGDFERPVLPVNQLESSVVDGCEGQNRSETGMENEVNGDLPHSLLVENIEVSAATELTTLKLFTMEHNRAAQWRREKNQ